MSSLIDSAVNELFKKFLVPLIVNQVMKRLVAKLPFLALPFINPLVALLLTKLVPLIFSELKTYFTFKAIDADVHLDVREFENAVDDFKDKLGGGTKEEQDKAHQELKNRARELIRWK